MSQRGKQEFQNRKNVKDRFVSFAGAKLQTMHVLYVRCFNKNVFLYHFIVSHLRNQENRSQHLDQDNHRIVHQ